MNKKNFTSIVFALLVSASTLAQNATIRVQGAPRKVSNETAARVQKAAETAATTCIDFSKIERWIGEGDCRAALAIKWADSQNEEKTLVWGYRWNSTETKSGEDLIRAIAKADPALYVMGINGAWGLTIGGIGYDADNDRFVSVTTMTDELYPRNGFVTVPTDEFETSAATDWGDGDAWNCGYFTGFWSYYVADNATDALQMSMVGATGRVLTDGCVDAYVFGSFDADAEANVYDGNLLYLPATTDFTTGTFVVNEGSYGHGNANVNYLAADGTWAYRNTEEIGATACFGTAWGNRYYIMAKQAKDNGATVEGGRITICDANSMRIIKQIAEIGGDGRSFCGVDEHRAYVGSTTGIYELDLDNMEIAKTVLTTENTNVEFGNMIRLGNYVYATEYGNNLHIIRCADNSLVKTIPATVYSITMSKDGALWVSTAEGVSRVNTSSLELEALSLGEGIEKPASSAGMWNPDGLCASLQNNVIYWTSSANWMTQKVFRYDIDKAEASLLLDYTTDPDSRNIYGAAFRVDPKTDCLYVNLVKGWSYNDNTVRKYAADGSLIAEYPMEEGYWFPETFVFPDTEDPVFGEMTDVTVCVGKEVSADINVSDADNFSAAIVKSVESVEDESIATASVKDGKLVVNGVKEGTTNIVVKAVSNGVSTTKTLALNVTATDGIAAAENTTAVREVARYTVDGKRANGVKNGVVIVRYSDGTAKKIVVK